MYIKFSSVLQEKIGNYYHILENRYAWDTFPIWIFYLGPSWAVQAAERNKIQIAISMQLLSPVFYVFMGEKNLKFILNTTLKSYMI